MKGSRSFHGEDKLAVILLNRSGEETDAAERADEYVTRYGMKGLPRVRLTWDEADRWLVSDFGHFGFGYAVIDAGGILRGTNLHAEGLERLLDRIIPAPAGSEAEDSDVTVRILREKGPSLRRRLRDGPAAATVEVGLSSASVTDRPEGAVHLEVDVRLPKGWELVSSNASAGDGGHLRRTLRVTIPKGTPVGRYLLHGVATLGGKGGAPAGTRRRWKTVLKIL